MKRKEFFQVIVLIEIYNINSYIYGSTIEAVSVHWRQLALKQEFVWICNNKGSFDVWSWNWGDFSPIECFQLYGLCKRRLEQCWHGRNSDTESWTAASFHLMALWFRAQQRYDKRKLKHCPISKQQGREKTINQASRQSIAPSLSLSCSPFLQPSSAGRHFVFLLAEVEERFLLLGLPCQIGAGPGIWCATTLLHLRRQICAQTEKHHVAKKKHKI